MKQKLPNYLEGYKQTIENAKGHFRAAELIAQVDKGYGIGESHLILAAEEAVKASMLFIAYYSPDLKVKDFERFFTDHKHKHNMIAEIEGLFSFLRKLEEAVKVISESKQTYLKENGSNENGLMSNEDPKVEKSVDAIAGALANEKKIKANEIWWKQADLRKQRGFYVSLDNQSTKWHSPASVSEKQYKKTKSVVEPFYRGVILLGELVADMERRKGPNALFEGLAERKEKNFSH